MTEQQITKEWFLDRYCGRQFAALVEDGKLTEFSSEKEPRQSCAGNIYKGVVVNVLSGMNAAFINCGLEKNCYLSMEETYTDYTKYDGTMGGSKDNSLNLKVGDEVIVQVTKPPRGTKGAKVTTHISFVGKFIIYLPVTDFLGISRKITDEKERERLLRAAEELRVNEKEGFIIRTQAPFASLEQIQTELDYLKKKYSEVAEGEKNAPVGALLYEDDDLPERVMRDCFGEEITAIHVGDESLYQKLLRIATLRGDIPHEKIHHFVSERSMLKEYGITPLVYDAANPVVPLENGGSIVIEHTEAMTVVDVNTGSYVGINSLEETVFAVNLQAAREIARQVRLRNIGGIIVVDFIDMTEEAHKEAVTEELKKHLSLDKAKCNVLPMSELCISQFTRKRVGRNALSYLEKACPHCGGAGYVHDDIFVVTRIRTALLDCFADGFDSAVVELNVQIMHKILEEGLFSIEMNNRWKEKRICFIPHKTYKEDYFSVRGEDGDFSAPNNACFLP
ncbi:MAG: Rne/Rng family ribonuclease [Clostridia bacterium]|nr:Rne/Rng family ribonuclease [Clostridia bacterium]MBP3422621.1 Rne/Rng family ribonuclease [Clostridia bacterium]